MPPQDDKAIRSFILVVYGSNGRELKSHQLPVSVVAPFAGRVAREAADVGDWGAAPHEHWFSLQHRYNRDFTRSAQPEGPTDLEGRRYDPSQEAGPAIHLHPAARVRSFGVTLSDFQKVLFQGEYGVDDVFLYGARYLLHRRIEKGDIAPELAPFYYAIVPSPEAMRTGPPGTVPNGIREVEGAFQVPALAKDAPRIQFRPVRQPSFPERDPATFGSAEPHGAGTPQAGRIFIPAKLYADLHSQLKLSDVNEEGGYVLGNVYRMPGSPEKEENAAYRWIVEVTDLLMAEDAVGTPVTLLFTGDTWSKVSRRRDSQYADRKLVGWFHTHIFPATDSFGLSGLDQNMHGWYLPKPWQIAILLNIEKEGGRTVRCYQRGPTGELVETPYGVFEPQAPAV